VPAPDVEALIAGAWIGAEDWIEVANPADRTQVVARVPALGGEEVGAAYDAAERGAALWRATSAFERADRLRETAKLLRERSEQIARSIVDENGKTIREARGEVGKAADFFDYYAGLAREGYGTLINDARDSTQTSFRREPVGVVLAITPWNDPLLTPARKLAPALMCGNAVVLKPATATPLSGLHLGRALDDAGLPAGVVNVVTGQTRDIAESLLNDERVAAVTFTGSNEVGEKLRSDLATRNVRFQGELGGKNAAVILKDADLEKAVAGVVAGSFGQAGQRCTATSRVIVDSEVADEVLGALVARIEGLRVGPGSSEDTDVCPLVSVGHRDSVLGFIERAREQGATVLTGGEAPADEALSDGCYVLPTVLADVATDSEIWQDEVFGPVIAVREVRGIDEAITATNDSQYGLAAAVFTTDLGATHRFIDEVDCGQIAVNTATTGWDVHVPFGGFRRSGSPFKEQGVEALNFYTKVKSVAMHVGS
jgi:alpha-ketoglutaric semialdehyde dehydrogenase